MPLSTSDVIQLLGIISAFCTSIVAIIISIKTLKQNNKMIEETSRPYISIYSDIVTINSIRFYLIIKNGGQRNATITSFRCNENLESFAYISNTSPFKGIDNFSFCPNQTITCVLDHLKLFNANITKLSFDISYTDGIQSYSDTFVINLPVYPNLSHPRTSADIEPDTTPEEIYPLITICKILEDFAEKRL